MKITFEDKSYIDLSKSTHPGKVIITIAARDKNSQSVVAHSVEITEDQLKELTKL